jgi:hypothetical protein
MEQTYGASSRLYCNVLHDLPTSLGRFYLVSGEIEVCLVCLLTLFETIGLWMPFILVSYALLYGSISLQTGGTWRCTARVLYQCKHHVTSILIDLTSGM